MTRCALGKRSAYALQGLQGVDDAFLLDDSTDHAQQQDIWRQSQFRHQFRARGAERVFGYPAIFHAIAHHLQLVRPRAFNLNAEFSDGVGDGDAGAGQLP